MPSWIRPGALANSAEEFGGGMLLRVADDGNADAEPGGDGAFGNRFGRVVGAFGVDIRAERLEKGFDICLVEDDDAIYGGESGDELGAAAFVHHGAAGPAQLARAGVGIDADDEQI